jgi:hypothetical protein
MRGLSAQDNLLVPVIASGIAMVALLWFIAIGPKRSEGSQAAKDATVQEQRLTSARA